MKNNNDKRYDLWEFHTQGENVIAQSNNLNYLKRKADKMNCIYCYIYDNFENKTVYRV